jgi:hypothetical protein
VQKPSAKEKIEVTEHGLSRGHGLNCPERSRHSRDTDRIERESYEKRTREEVPGLWNWGARREAWEHARALAEPREEDAAIDPIVMTDYQSFLSSSSSVRNLLPPPVLVLLRTTVLTARSSIEIREPCMLGGPRWTRLGRRPKDCAALRRGCPSQL